MPAQQFEFQSSAKEPMEFTYKHSTAPKGELFIIPAIIPARLMDVQEAAQREQALMKGRSKKEKEDSQRRVGTLMIEIFVQDVLPDDMRKILHLPDAGPIFEMWAEYVELGEGQGSDG